MNRSQHSSPLARVGPYELAAKVGAGGMGSVYRARDSRDGRTVALKLMHEHVASDPSYAERFRREAAMAALIDSPNVVRVLEFASDNGRPYIVTEFVDGPAVDSLIKQGPLPAEQAIAIGAGVAGALAEGGRRNIVHRDIKPANILIASDGTPKVTDFGIATLDQGSSLTVPGVFIGTAAYAAPEQHHGATDIRSDIYSLGVVLFEMLTGSLPFKAETATGMMRLHAESAVPLERLAGQPEAVAAVVARCLEKDPGRRFQNPGELLSALGGLRAPVVAAPAVSSADDTVIEAAPAAVAGAVLADAGATVVDHGAAHSDPSVTVADPDSLRQTGEYPLAAAGVLGWRARLNDVPVLRRAALAGAAVAAVTVGIMVGFGGGSAAGEPGYSSGGGGGSEFVEVIPRESPEPQPTFEVPSETPPPAKTVTPEPTTPIKTVTPEPTPTQPAPTATPTKPVPAPTNPPAPALSVVSYVMCHLDACPYGSQDLYAGWEIAVGFQLSQVTSEQVWVEVWFDDVYYYTSTFTPSSNGMYFDLLPHANYSGELALDVYVGGRYVDTLWGWVE